MSTPRGKQSKKVHVQVDQAAARAKLKIELRHELYGGIDASALMDGNQGRAVVLQDAPRDSLQIVSIRRSHLFRLDQLKEDIFNSITIIGNQMKQIWCLPLQS